MMAGIVILDLHGKTAVQAKVTVDAALRCSRGVYRLRLIHGCHGGTVLRDMIAKTYARHSLVLRMESLGGVTELVLREF